MSELDALRPRATQDVEPRQDPSSLLESAGQALFRLGRWFSKQSMRERLIERKGTSPELSHILVTEAVAVRSEEPGREITVGVVAERLAIDPSTASRLVAETMKAGYISRLPSQADNRRLRLELTASGYELVEYSHHYQRAIFEHVTQDWPDQERQDFARLLIKFVESVTETSGS